MKNNPSPAYIPHHTPRITGGSERSTIARRMMNRMRCGRDVRTEKVEQVRRSLQSGAYSLEEKLDIAVDRLLDELDAAIVVVRKTREAAKAAA